MKEEMNVSAILWLFQEELIVHTRCVNSQFGLAVPGVSGRKKKARTATGREMTPLMTIAGNISMLATLGYARNAY